MRPRTVGLLALALLAVSTLTGCINPETDDALNPDTDEDCHGFTIPPAHGGSTYHYDANGTVWLSAALSVIADWAAVNGSGGQGAVTLNNGSTLEVQIANLPTPTHTVTARPGLAFQASYIASDPQQGQGLTLHHVWINATNGQTTATMFPYEQKMDDRFRHTNHLTRLDWPALFHAVDLWDRELQQGTTWRHSFPAGHPLPVDDPHQVNLTHRVENINKTNQGCQAHILTTFKHTRERLSTHTTQTTFTNDTALPLSYQVYRHRNGDPSLLFDLHLNDHQPGSGLALPPLDREPTVTSGLPIHPTENGFLAQADGIFPTDWPQVFQALHKDNDASQWLDQHPNARPVYVEHRLGANSSDIIDQWRIDWWPGPNASDAMNNVVQNRTGTFPLLQDPEITVQTETGGSVPDPQINQGPALAGLAEVHEGVYGKPIETIRCHFDYQSCLVGPHEATGMSRAGSFGGSVAVWSGMIFDLRDGRLLQETSLAERLVPPPALEDR